MLLAFAGIAWFRSKDDEIPNPEPTCKERVESGECDSNRDFMNEHCTHVVCTGGTRREEHHLSLLAEAAYFKAVRLYDEYDEKDARLPEAARSSQLTDPCERHCNQSCSSIPGSAAARCRSCSSSMRCWTGAADYEAAAGHHHANFFRGARVAVLLTGEAFRPMRRFPGTPRACHDHNSSLELQRRITAALITHVIEPFEESGALTSVLLTFPSCGETSVGRALLRELVRLFDGRVVASRIVQSTCTTDSLYLAFGLLWDHMGRMLAAAYDYVLSVRHDLEILTPVTEWAVDWARLLFHASPVSVTSQCLGCVPERGDFEADPCGCRPSTDDKIMWVPRKHLPAVLAAVCGLQMIIHLIT